MNCKISCSFGEIIDKVTILNIKQRKVTNQEALFNIQTELRLIENDNPQTKTKDKLFDNLHDTNLKLWDLEDKIRGKSAKKEYDSEYIKCAELIHITNDLRYKIKRKINEKYNSLIKEEKIYDCNIKSEYEQLDRGKILYTKGEYKESMKVLKSLMTIYKNYEEYDEFYIDLLFSYNNICSIFNVEFPYYEKITDIMKNIDILNISKEQKQFCKEHYALSCLSQNKYNESYDYLNQLNLAERNKELNGKMVKHDNMSFFKEGDNRKTLLLYNGGGIGDGFMYTRFIPIVLERFPNNDIIFISDKRTSWIYQKTFEKNKSVTIKEYSDENVRFDYHCNVICLIKYLGYEYDTLPFTPLFETITLDPSLLCRQILWKISCEKKDKKCYIFNWKGSNNNAQELKNRKMELKHARSLFQMKNINWIIVTKDLTTEENELLDEYDNVCYFGNILDSHGTYIDTLCIMRHIDGVISTDTSIIHLSANLNVNTYALLTIGCEWRWTRSEKTTNWYPNVKLFRQKRLGDWGDAVREVVDELKAKKV